MSDIKKLPVRTMSIEAVPNLHMQHDAMDNQCIRGRYTGAIKHTSGGKYAVQIITAKNILWLTIWPGCCPRNVWTQWQQQNIRVSVPYYHDSSKYLVTIEAGSTQI